MFPLDLPVKYSQVLIKFGHPGNRYIGTQVDLGAWVPVSFTVLRAFFIISFKDPPARAPIRNENLQDTRYILVSGIKPNGC